MIEKILEEIQKETKKQMENASDNDVTEQ